MFVMGNLLQAVAIVLDYILWAYMWIIIARALISWVNPDPWNPIVRFLERATEPVLSPIRRRLGYGMGLDLSPLIAILVIIFLQVALVQTLKEVAFRMH
jgi:YggT family protein